ncbi:MAG: MerC domain-containing protein [Saprospiraceae bacterium]
MQKSDLSKADYLGVVASAVCMLHCTIIPALMLIQNFSHLAVSLQESSWYENLDYFFIAISGFAIFLSTYFVRNHRFTKIFLTAWLLQIAGVILEKSEMSLAIYLITLSSLLLIITHVKNYKSHTH